MSSEYWIDASYIPDPGCDYPTFYFLLIPITYAIAIAENEVFNLPMESIVPKCTGNVYFLVVVDEYVEGVEIMTMDAAFMNAGAKHVRIWNQFWASVQFPSIPELSGTNSIRDKITTWIYMFKNGIKLRRHLLAVIKLHGPVKPTRGVQQWIQDNMSIFEQGT